MKQANSNVTFMLIIIVGLIGLVVFIGFLGGRGEVALNQIMGVSLTERLGTYDQSMQANSEFEYVSKEFMEYAESVVIEIFSVKAEEKGHIELIDIKPPEGDVDDYLIKLEKGVDGINAIVFNTRKNVPILIRTYKEHPEMKKRLCMLPRTDDGYAARDAIAQATGKNIIDQPKTPAKPAIIVAEHQVPEIALYFDGKELRAKYFGDDKELQELGDGEELMVYAYDEHICFFPKNDQFLGSYVEILGQSIHGKGFVEDDINKDIPRT